MTRIRSAFAINLRSAAVIAVLTSLTSAGSSFATEKAVATRANLVWSLDQSSSVIGDQRVWISDQRIDIVDQGTGVRTTASAPDWTVYTIDETSKVYASAKPESYKGFVPDEEFKHLGLVDWNSLPLFFFGITRYVAYEKAFLFDSGAHFTGVQQKQFQNQFAAPTFVKSGQYLVSKDQIGSAEACTIMARYYRVPDPAKLSYSTSGHFAIRPPDFSGPHKRDIRRRDAVAHRTLKHPRAVPLKFQYANLNGHKSDWLATTGCKPATGFNFRTIDVTTFKHVATAGDVKAAAKRTDFPQKRPAKKPLL